ncbi:hypothetical protein, partial [Deinococcus piscis]|uniref:hypothetical protein n=1 Tax=Deinococcus piscis TaxID=394230 RepID=UPI001E522DDE
GQLVEPTGELQYDAIYTRKLLTIVYWRPISLKSNEVGDFFQDLLNVMERYTVRESEGGAEHIMGIQLVRKP